MKKMPYRVSAIILAGGLSKRMGTRKVELMWGDVTLLQHQVDKMRELGISDIIISGCSAPIEGTRFVADKYLFKGPLGGIHTGLLAAKFSHCLVTGIDTPLVPLETYQELIRAHSVSSANITLLSHGDKIEPLMGMYESWLSGICEQILCTDNTSVRVLLGRVGCSKLEYDGDERLLCDCNTPREYEYAKDRLRAAAENII